MDTAHYALRPHWLTNGYPYHSPGAPKLFFLVGPYSSRILKQSRDKYYFCTLPQQKFLKFPNPASKISPSIGTNTEKGVALRNEAFVSILFRLVPDSCFIV